MIPKKRASSLVVGCALLIGAAWASGVVESGQERVPTRPAVVAIGSIPYSGRLAGKSGQPVSQGDYDFRFSLYDAEAGGTHLWTETQRKVPVRGGGFSTTLGRVNPIPTSVLLGRKLWLTVEVQGPMEAGFTALTPRQSVSQGAPLSATVPAQAPSCPHDHLGESWHWATAGSNGISLTGAVTWPNGLLWVANSADGPAVWGVNTLNGSGVRGDGYGTALGVVGDAENGVGVVGNSSGNHGMSGGTSASGKAGIFGQGTGASVNFGVAGESENGYGVYGRDGGANPDDAYGVYSQGDIFTSDDLRVTDQLTVGGLATFNGGKVGYVVDIALNDDIVPLEAGDVVVISGSGPAVVGEIPVIKVRRANSMAAGAVVGIVDKHYVPAPPRSAATPNSTKTPDSVIDEATIVPGQYLTIVTLGSYKGIKVDASLGAINPGDLLVAAPSAGHAMKSIGPAPGTVIGKALGALPSGIGVIPAMITLH